MQSFKQWLENHLQELLPFMTKEDPLSDKEIKKIKKYKSLDNYIKSATKGSRKTEQGAEAVAKSFINGIYLGPEEVEQIYKNQIVIPIKQFNNITKPERYIAIVKLKQKNPNINGKYSHRLLALYQGKKDTPITKETILDNEHQILSSIVFQDGYITHVWSDPEYKHINLYSKMREFARKYYGIHNVHPEDDLTSKSFRAAEAKYKWKKVNEARKIKPFSLEKELSYYEKEPNDDIKSTKDLDYDTISQSYNHYYNAMGRRRHGSQLEWEGFFNYVTSPDVHHFRFKDSIVYGQMHNDVFIPSHFAPKNLREGIKLMEKLKDTNCALLVPEDLSIMAQKVGFKLVQRNVPAIFRGEVIFKNVLASNNYVVKKIKDYIQNNI